MTSPSPAPARRHPATHLRAVVAAICLLAGCVPMPTDATTTSRAATSNVADVRSVIPAAYYLREVDGRPLPTLVGDGLTVTSAYVVADTTARNVIGWGEGISKDSAASFRLGLGAARVLSQGPDGTCVAVIAWGGNMTALDTVRWTPDSVIFSRTISHRSAVGAGRRLVYTRNVAADTL